MEIGLFLLNVLASILIGVVAIYFPGRLVLRLSRLMVSPLEKLAIALVTGVVLLTLIYWLLHTMQMGWLLWPVFLLLTGFEFWFEFKERKIKSNQLPDPDTPAMVPLKVFWPLGVIAVLLAVMQGWFIFTSGWENKTGMSFLAWHGIDAPWHIYNIIQFARQAPAEMTGFSGEVFKNYHAFSDLFLGAVHRLLPINPWHLYFRIAPFFYSVMLTLLTFVVVYTWKQDKRSSYLAAVMMILVSNFGYVMAILFPDKNYAIWDSLFWVQPPLTHLINPATSTSYLFFLGGLWSFLKWMISKEKGYLILVGLIWGILPGFKVYPGLLVLMTLLTMALLTMLIAKRYSVLAAFLSIIPIQALIVLPAMSSTNKLIHFVPGYNLGTMLVSPDRWNLMSSQALKQLYVDNPLMVAMIMAGLMLAFIIGNLGTRIIALPAMISSLLKIKKADDLILFSTIFSGGALIAATCFIQTGLKWNTIQFFYHVIVLTTIIAAIQFWQWLKPIKKEWQIVLITAFIAIGVPGTFQAMKVINWSTTINQDLIQSMNWIKKQHPNGDTKILRPLPDNLKTIEGFNTWLHELERGQMTSITAIEGDAKEVTEAAKSTTSTAIAKVQLMETATTLERIDTAIIAPLALNNTYLEDLRRASIMGYPVIERAKKVDYFYKEANVIDARDFIEQEGIEYVILLNGDEFPFEAKGVPLKKVLENKTLTVYKFINPRGW